MFIVCLLCVYCVFTMCEYRFILLSVIGYLILSQKNISSIYFRIFFTYKTLRCKEYDSFNNQFETNY